MPIEKENAHTSKALKLSISFVFSRLNIKFRRKTDLILQLTQMNISLFENGIKKKEQASDRTELGTFSNFNCTNRFAFKLAMAITLQCNSLLISIIELMEPGCLSYLQASRTGNVQLSPTLIGPLCSN